MQMDNSMDNKFHKDHNLVEPAMQIDTTLIPLHRIHNHHHNLNLPQYKHLPLHRLHSNNIQLR